MSTYKMPNCPYCNFFVRSKSGLMQHIMAKAECNAKQQQGLGMLGARKPPPDYDKPKWKPRVEPFGHKTPTIRPPEPQDPPPSKVPRVARMPSPELASRPEGYSEKELAMMEKQLNEHPDRTIEDWREMAHLAAKSPTAGGKSVTFGHTSTTEDRTQDDSVVDFGMADDYDDGQRLESGADQDNNIEADAAETNNNSAANGYQLNEDVEEGEEDFNNDGFLNQNVNTEMRDSFRAFCKQAKQNWFPKLKDAEARGVRLLNILHQKSRALDTYDDVLLWHFREQGVLDADQSLKDAKDQYVSRTKLLTDLAKRYNMDTKAPFVKPTTLPFSKQKIELVCRDAWGCIESLLTDPRLTDDDFWFPDGDPFADPPETLKIIGDLQTGRAFRKAHKLYKKKPNQIPLPIVAYLDGANTGHMKSMPITAFKITLGIFTRKYRDLDHAWAVLGHVHHVSKAAARASEIARESRHIDRGVPLDADEDEDADDSAEEKGGTSRDLHHMLDIILESYRDVQKRGFLWDLRYRGQTYMNVEFIPYMIFVKCDTQEGDQLCGSYTNRNKHVANLCRYCTCPREDTDNPQADYPFKTVPMMKAYIDTNDLDQLTAYSQHNIDNAFYKLRFSPDSNRGIHGATASEMLHAVLLGTFMMVRDVSFEQFGDKSALAKEFDGLAMLYGGQFKRQSEREMPKCSFSAGIREGKLNAKEYRGILLVMAAVFRSQRGRIRILRNKNFTAKKIQDWLELLEIILCWEAFLCQPTMTLTHVLKLVFKHRLLLWMIKKTACRKTGMGLKLMKYHAITHLAKDILLFGVPLEVDTGSNESGHKETKKAARTTQKNEKTFDLQTATRLDQFRTTELAMQELRGLKIWEYFDKPERKRTDHELPDKIVTTGTVIKVFRVNNDIAYAIGSGKAGNTAATHVWDKDILEFLIDGQERVAGWMKNAHPKLDIKNYRLNLRGEHIRNGVRFHGSPFFRDRHWRDWCMVDWGYGPGKAEPAQIWCFLVFNDLPKPKKNQKFVYGSCELSNGVFAVIECASFRKPANTEPKSRIFVPLVKEMRAVGAGGVQKRKFYLVDTNAIVDTCYVVADISDIPGKTHNYFQVKNRDDWIIQFEDWMAEPDPPEYIADKQGQHL